MKFSMSGGITVVLGMDVRLWQDARIDSSCDVSFRSGKGCTTGTGMVFTRLVGTWVSVHDIDPGSLSCEALPDPVAVFGRLPSAFFGSLHASRANAGLSQSDRDEGRGGATATESSGSWADAATEAKSVLLSVSLSW